ncbi:unnamed protein product [Cyprideis torosa]|uniref:O-acyltransferase WSD1 C-terminal domain-containing protein n=1 Tax=Cyprideis torosa TaxID=163714 RepID=A0A7R8WG41_9CRUS|nr:unnamed protein product [Cyprideis torosa]CAG0897743.1 unnamed protein product [Cyprideis torosa]
MPSKKYEVTSMQRATPLVSPNMHYGELEEWHLTHYGELDEWHLTHYGELDEWHLNNYGELEEWHLTHYGELDEWHLNNYVVVFEGGHFPIDSGVFTQPCRAVAPLTRWIRARWSFYPTLQSGGPINPRFPIVSNVTAAISSVPGINRRCKVLGGNSIDAIRFHCMITCNAPPLIFHFIGYAESVTLSLSVDSKALKSVGHTAEELIGLISQNIEELEKLSGTTELGI